MRARRLGGETVRALAGDPYFNHIVELDAAARFPVLLALRTTLREFAVAAAASNGTIELSGLYLRAPRALQEATYCTALVHREFFARTARTARLHDAIERLEVGSPGLGMPDALPAPRRRSSPPRVLTAVLDDGLAFANRRFLRADGTSRMEYLWVQGGAAGVLSGARIDAALAASTHAGLVDEDEVYRRLAVEDYRSIEHKTLGRRWAHGTHVMDLACGEAPDSPRAERPIVGVQFPAAAIRDTSGAWLAPHLFAGLWFVLAAANEIARRHRVGPLPVAANVSVGKFADAHDGRSILELAIDEMVALWAAAGSQFTVVLPAGNSYLERCHARFALEPGERRELVWRIKPDDRTPSYLEVWPAPAVEGGRAPALEVTVQPPGRGPSITVRRGTRAEAPGRGPLWCADYRAAGRSGHRDRVVIAVAPTATLDPTAGIAPAGSWRVVVTNRDARERADVWAWVQRDDSPFGWPVAGRQSRFEDPEYERFDRSERYDRGAADGRERAIDERAGYVRRAGSLNAIATGESPVVVGAFRKSDYRAAWYAAAGPRPPGRRRGFDVDLMAVGDESIACGGVLAAATRSGGAAAMRGTSVAAPQITRRLADRLALERSADRAAAQTLAAAASVPAGAPRVPAARMGAGRVDVRVPARVERR